ncbi:MAG TPA: AarF/UbiB family protein, partial [Blastocatellia bacterium]
DACAPRGPQGRQDACGPRWATMANNKSYGKVMAEREPTTVPAGTPVGLAALTPAASDDRQHLVATGTAPGGASKQAQTNLARQAPQATHQLQAKTPATSLSAKQASPAAGHKALQPQGTKTDGRAQATLAGPKKIVAPAPSSAEYPWPEHIGIAGYLRLLRIFETFILFGARVYVNSRGWLNFHKLTQTEMRHKEGALLRAKLLLLGPTFIKIGQTLATRADIMPVEYIQELQSLQDEVPAFPWEIARTTIEQGLNHPLETVFENVDPVPLAAASLGQVHRANLITGESVVIKVQRPNLHEQIAFDISVLRRVARFLTRFPNLVRGVDWQGSLGEFQSTIFEEMDYHKEAQNAEVFRKNFEKWKEVYVPRIHHELSSPYVIVMEYIRGFKVTDVDELRAAGIDPSAVVRLLARTYLKQLLEDGVFHADPHPGNLRVMPDRRLAFFDFGMVGRLDMELQSKLINAFFHTMERDVHGLVEDMVRLGFIELTPEEEARFKPIIEGLMDRYLSIKLKNVQFKELVFDLAHVIYEFPFHIPASFTYIIRAMMTLEGIGTLVDPDFNFFEVAKPYAKRFMFKREGRYLRNLIVDSLIKGEGGKIEWDKVWKLGKMMFRYYVRGEYKL